MFSYIIHISNPFDMQVKFNLKYPLTQQKISATLALADVKQKQQLERCIPLVYTCFVIAGTVPRYSHVRKSVAKFATREGDMIGVYTYLNQRLVSDTIDYSVQQGIYEYYATLYRSNIGMSEEASTTVSFPDFRYLFMFKALPIHGLSYSFGFDMSFHTKLRWQTKASVDQSDIRHYAMASFKTLEYPDSDFMF